MFPIGSLQAFKIGEQFERLFLIHATQTHEQTVSRGVEVRVALQRFFEALASLG